MPSPSPKTVSTSIRLAGCQSELPVTNDLLRLLIGCYNTAKHANLEQFVLPQQVDKTKDHLLLTAYAYYLIQHLANLLHFEYTLTPDKIILPLN